MRRISLMLILALASAAALAEVTGTIVTQNGDTRKGVLRWSNREKAYVMATKNGVELEIKESEVSELNVDKPAGYDAAVAAVASGKGASAIPALKKIVEDYKHLQWDKSAGRYLAEAYIAASNADEAYKVCQAIIAGEPTAAYQGDLAPAYWAALLGQGKMPQLEKQLEKAMKSEDRFAMGSALIMRGDIIRKTMVKDPNGGARKALLDGYLRVVFTFTDEVAPLVRPEALYKAALCFEQLSMSGRADAMRRELKGVYPNSPWAAK